MDGDNEFSVLHLTIYHSREMPFVLARHVRSATHYLHPLVLFIRQIQSIDMLVSSYQELTFCFFEQRSPEFGTSPLPLCEIAFMLIIHISGEKVTWIHFRTRVVERNVTKGNEIRSTCYLWLFECISEPFSLGNPIRFTHKEVAEPGVRIQLILRSI